MTTSSSIGFYGPDLLIVMRSATHRVLQAVHDGPSTGNSMASLAVNTAVAKAVMDLVSMGERDEQRLTEGALSIVCGAASRPPLN